MTFKPIFVCLLRNKLFGNILIMSSQCPGKRSFLQEPGNFGRASFLHNLSLICSFKNHIHILYYIHFGTVIKHVRHSFDLLLCSLMQCFYLKKTCNETPHVMTWCDVFFNKNLQLHFHLKPSFSCS